MGGTEPSLDASHNFRSEQTTDTSARPRTAENYFKM